MKKVFCAFIPLFLAGCQLKKEAAAVSPPVAEGTNAGAFEKTIKPFFENTCLACHNDKRSNAGLNFQNPATIFASHPRGRFLDPGSPETSRIYLAIIKPKTHPGAMPANGWGIDLIDMALLRTWIEEGARWPEGAAGRLEIKPHIPKPEDRPQALSPQGLNTASSSFWRPSRRDFGGAAAPSFCAGC